MRKLTYLSFFLISALAMSCTNPDQATPENQADTNANKSESLVTNDIGPSFIPMDSANKMIQSYLTSVGYPENDDSLLSLSVNAEDLRAFLQDSSITNIKLMFAHRMEYINAGNDGVHCGYSPDGLTLILAAYDANGDYIFYGGNHVMDRMAPCPPSCPLGDAANPLLVEK